MQAVLTLITAASLLLHTVLGCCSRCVEAACGCEHCATSHDAETKSPSHDAAHGCAHSHRTACGHVHDDVHAHGGLAEQKAETPAGDERLPSEPCRNHCEGNRCLAIVAASVPVVELDLTGVSVLPPLAETTIASGGSQSSFAAADAQFATPALPLRAHLLYQMLLI